MKCRYGLWGKDAGGESSNYQELRNLVETVEEECENDKLLDTELWIFSSREAVFTRVVMAGVICWITSTWQRQRWREGQSCCPGHRTGLG